MTATRLYDAPAERELFIDDDDLLTVTTLTNGDGTVLTTADYILLPNNATPKFGIKLRESSSYSWEPTSAGNYEQAISVAGTWGYAATAPDDIYNACLQLAAAMYERRMGENVTGVTTITAAGVVIAPQDIPASVREILRPYRRVV